MSNPLITFIAESVKVITELAEIFGLSKPRQNLDPTIQSWYRSVKVELDRQNVSNSDEALKITIKFIKYKIGAYVAVGQNTPIPDTPFQITDDKPEVLIGGRWMVYIKRYILEGPRKWEFLSSLKHVKSGLPRPTTGMAEAAAKATVEKLTTEPPPYSMHDEATKATLIRELRRTVKELFHGHHYTKQHQMRNFFPSTNSNYINTRSKFGALKTVLDTVEELNLRESSNSHKIIIHKVDNDGDEIMSEDSPQYHIRYDDSGLQEKYQILMNTLHDRATKEVAHVKPVGL